MAGTTETLATDGASYAEMHGRSAPEGQWEPPVRSLTFDANARSSFTKIIAHEYRETPGTFLAKIKVLAGMLRRAKRPMAYTGAGLSTAAGIHDYASKGDGAGTAAKKDVKNWREAEPTSAHRVMARLHAAGLLHHWINQNHDSLPQKAGFPQHALNEIHGSLHDPANPIVPYQGSLRDDLFKWMQQWQQEGDLCLALGTSLSGFNADQVVATQMDKFERGSGLGVVLVNLQRTEYDHGCSLRIFGELDAVMEALAHELGGELDAVPSASVAGAENAGLRLDDDQVLVRGFDPHSGLPRSGGEMAWDLRLGSYFRLTGGPYSGDIGKVSEKSADGHYKLRFEHSVDETFKTRRRPFGLWLGSWWVDEALSGRGIGPGGPVPLVPAEAPAEEPAGSADEFGIEQARERIAKLAKVGLPVDAIRAKMKVEGFALETIDNAVA